MDSVLDVIFVDNLAGNASWRLLQMSSVEDQ